MNCQYSKILLVIWQFTKIVYFDAMKWFQLENLKLIYIKGLFLSTRAISVRLPLSLNIVGKIYHLETSMISREYIYLKVYEEDFDFLPIVNSNILIFMNLNLFNNGKLDLEGKLISIDRLGGSRLGLWIEYKTELEKEKKIISDFVVNHYTPRYSVRFDVEINNTTNLLKAEAINLSEKGIFIEAPPDRLEENEICTLVLFPENFSIPVKAQVSWINKGKMYDKPNGYGFKFLAEKKSRTQILKYISILKKRSAMLR